MDKLVERTPSGGLSYWSDQESVGKMAEMLAAYQDSGLMPERAKELGDADKNGRLVVLPLSEGTPLFEVRTIFGRTQINELEFDRYSPKYYIDLIGKEIFLTREAAEKALEVKT